MQLAFLADLNISPQTVSSLRQRGWDIHRVSDELPATAPDEEILAFARREKRIIVTQDLDFSALVALSRLRQPSLVTLRLSVTDPDQVTNRLTTTLPVLEDELRAGCAVTVEDLNVRIRKLPITPS